MDWQPIKTAPKDGTRVLVATIGRAVFVASWNGEAEFDRFETGPGWQIFVCEDGFYSWALSEPEVVAWMPLPEPPEE